MGVYMGPSKGLGWKRMNEFSIAFCFGPMPYYAKAKPVRRRRGRSKAAHRRNRRR